MDSPSGARWHNYDIASIVDGYLSFYEATEEETPDYNKDDTYSWLDIHYLLIIGKNYE